jgi:murein DD-endopeptidase MepM/ murein hydrolase activator NlpD
MRESGAHGMFPSDPRRRTQLPRSHFFITVARGQGARTFALRSYAIWTLISLLPLALIWAGAATLYIAFHDDMLAAYLTREARMQNAYEDRVAEARAELDRVASRQLLDQTSFEGRMHELLTRQARIDEHDRIIEALATQAADRDPPSAPRGRPGAKIDAAKGLEAPSRPIALESGAKPRAPEAAKPAAGEDRGDSLSDNSLKAGGKERPADLAAAASDPNLDAAARLGLVAFSLDRLEHGQIAALAEIAGRARHEASKIDAIVARTGLNQDQLAAPSAKGGVGGPFIAIEPSASAPAFDKAYAHAARELERAEKLRELMVYLPVRAPLTGEAPVSSPFGYRTDPFLGRPALHPGVDLVQPAGSDIKATAGGRVTHAGWMGGYGEMVEIDHGNGLATRYGHMSDVLVDEGDTVKAGETIGRVGTTGRSTGPHLHYEVRVDGEPVDPERFLEAADAAP